MHPELRTHTLLRIADLKALRCDTPAPPWVTRELHRAPWLVVRRAAVWRGLVPVGVRGALRSERFAAWLRPADVAASLDPLDLAARRGWLHAPRGATVPALAALGKVEESMRGLGLASSWGPTGSVGFELASGRATAGLHSDLDLIVRAERPLTGAVAAALREALLLLPTKADVLLETPAGAVAFTEYMSKPRPILLRTVSGVRLVMDPWAQAAAA
jgi:phosphoribosyl-dephospho-CoA transferase